MKCSYWHGKQYLDSYKPCCTSLEISNYNFGISAVLGHCIPEIMQFPNWCILVNKKYKSYTCFLPYVPYGIKWETRVCPYVSKIQRNKESRAMDIKTSDWVAGV